MRKPQSNIQNKYRISYVRIERFSGTVSVMQNSTYLPMICSVPRPSRLRSAEEPRPPWCGLGQGLSPPRCSRMFMIKTLLYLRNNSIILMKEEV